MKFKYCHKESYSLKKYGCKHFILSYYPSIVVLCWVGFSVDVTLVPDSDGDGAIFGWLPQQQQQELLTPPWQLPSVWPADIIVCVSTPTILHLLFYSWVRSATRGRGKVAAERWLRHCPPKKRRWSLGVGLQLPTAPIICVYVCRINFPTGDQ